MTSLNNCWFLFNQYVSLKYSIRIVVRGQACLLLQGQGCSASQFWGFHPTYAYALWCWMTKIGMITHIDGKVHVLGDHLHCCILHKCICSLSLIAEFLVHLYVCSVYYQNQPNGPNPWLMQLNMWGTDIHLKKHHCLVQQEAQLMLTDPHSAMKSVKVTKHGTVQYVRCGFLLGCYSNFVPLSFEIFDL